MDTCYQECSEDPAEEDSFINPNWESREEARLEPISEDTRQKLVDQTMRLGDALFENLHTLDSEEIELPATLNLGVVSIFRKTMEILGKACHHPFLHRDFINRVTHGFLFLLSDFGTHMIQDVRMEEYEDIMDALRFCEEQGAPFRLGGLICKSKAVVKKRIFLEVVSRNAALTLCTCLDRSAGPACGKNIIRRGIVSKRLYRRQVPTRPVWLVHWVCVERDWCRAWDVLHDFSSKCKHASSVGG